VETWQDDLKSSYSDLIWGNSGDNSRYAQAIYGNVPFDVKLDLSEFVQLLRDLPQAFESFSSEFLSEAAAIVERDWVSNAPVGATGTYRDSIYAEPIINTPEGKSIAVLSADPKAEYVERGRGPGYPPPPELLVDWVKIKLDVADDAEAFEVAHAVARNIAKFGTIRHQEWEAGIPGAMGKAYLNNIAQIMGLAESLADKQLSRL